MIHDGIDKKCNLIYVNLIAILNAIYYGTGVFLQVHLNAYPFFIRSIIYYRWLNCEKAEVWTLHIDKNANHLFHYHCFEYAFGNWQ